MRVHLGRAILAVGAVVAVFGSLAPAAHAADQAPSLRPDAAPIVAGMRVLSGNLHDHTTDSDGDAASADVANWLKRHHQDLGLDFETLTDHSDAFPLALGAPTSLLPWKRQASLDKALTNNDFSLLRGFEFTNDQQDHLNVIGSQNWISRFVAGDATLTMGAFWHWLTTHPVKDPTGNGLGYGGADGVGQFNHPDDKGALNWDDFAFDAEAAKRMATIEIHGGPNKNAGDLMSSDAGWYWFALAKGWTVSPVMNFDFHDWHGDGVVDKAKPGADCGVRGYLPCQRSLVVTDENTPDAIMSALRHRRTTASQLPDLWATLRNSDGSWQGSTVAGAPGQTITLVVDAGTDAQTLTSVDIVSDAGINPDNAHYDGDNDIDLANPDQMLPSFLIQKIKHALGRATTKKQRVDGPPAGAIVANVPLTGHRATKTITVQIPNTPSRRPDGKHFFYAIAHATPPAGATGNGVTARAWTGPILTSGEPAGLWVAGDTHVHDDHSSDGSVLRQGVSQGMPGNVSVADQIGQAERMGLGFLPLTDHRTYDQHWDPLWTSDKLVLIPGEEANGSPHATPLGLADEIVDGANPPGALPYRHVQQSIWDIHAQNASWGMAHPDDGEWDGTYPTANANVLGVDTVEAWNRASTPDEEIEFSEQRWNHGYRFGVVGGADDHFRELWALAGPGQPTTWVFAPEATERGVIAGLRAGRTSISSGPLGPRVTLTADMNGDGIFEAVGGDEVSAVPGRQAFLKIRVERGATSTVSVYAAPGKRGGAAPIAQFKPLLGDKTFVVPIGATKAWYRVEVRGAGGPAGLNGQYNPADSLLALTSPLFVDQGTPATAVQEQPMPAMSSGPDNAATAIESPGEFSGWSDVAGNGQHVVAEADVNGRARVIYRHLPDGAPVVLSDLGDNARFPAVASRGDDVWVAWQNERSPQTPHKTNVVMRHSPDGGATWESIRSITTDDKSQHPAIAATPNGHPFLAWQSNAGGAFNVWSQVLGVDAAPRILSAAGKTVVQGNALDTRSAIYPASVFPSIAVSPTGALAIAWQDNRLDIDAGWSGSTKGEGTEPDDWDVFAVTRPSESAAWSFPVDVSRDKFRADRHPSVVYDDAGNLFAAWDRKVLQESGANLELRYAVRNPATGQWAASQSIAPEPHAMSERPQLALTDGGVRAVWYDSRSADWRWSIWSAALTVSAAGAPTRLTGNGNATYPRVDRNAVSFTSDRHATRPQRDPTQGVFVLNG